jgi:Flp pilus assembly protein TadB
VVTVLGALADPAVAGDLLGTPVGLTCLLMAVVLDATGAWWMHRIVRVVR